MVGDETTGWISETERAARSAPASLLLTALRAHVGIPYLLVASPLSPGVCCRGSLVPVEASPLVPCETELGCQGLWPRLLGDMKSAVIQAKKEKRQPQQRPLSEMSGCLFFAVAFVFNSIFTWTLLSVIKAFKETCCKSSRDSKMQGNECNIQDRNQEI